MIDLIEEHSDLVERQCRVGRLAVVVVAQLTERLRLRLGNVKRQRHVRAAGFPWHNTSTSASVRRRCDVILLVFVHWAVMVKYLCFLE